MTKLALRGLRSVRDMQDLSAEDRSTYRRWARRSCAIYVIALGVLFAGFWIHDLNVRVADQIQPVGASSAGDLPTLQISGGKSRRGYF